MRQNKRILQVLGIMILILSTQVSLAKTSPAPASVDSEDSYEYDLDDVFTPHSANSRYSVPVVPSLDSKSPVTEREKKEDKISANSFAIAFYKPTYVLPYYYTFSPYNAAYQNSTPQNEGLKNAEVKYQISVKVPILKDILQRPSSLYFAYTQLSYWQLYNRSAFFRETDYEPEFFLANEIHYSLPKKWHLDFFNLGAVHQSNGFGGTRERTWNRLYVELIASNDNWMVSLKPWYILHNGIYNHDNPDMATFLGYGRLLIAYKYKSQVFSLEAHNFIEGHARSATGLLTWSFPLTCYIKGYLQYFSGYGQSLIEYNHRTNSAGIGLAFNDWV